MSVARPLKRRASPGPDSVDLASNHTVELTFTAPSSVAPDPPSAQSTLGPLGLQTTISFAPNVTPGTFTAPPQDDALLDGASSHPTLFPDAVGVVGGYTNPSAAKRRRKTTPASNQATNASSKLSGRKLHKSGSSRPSTPAPESKCSLTPNSTDAPAHIPRPPNAFILFRSSFIRSQHVSTETEGNHGTLSKIVGMLWHSLSYEERQVWQAKARRAYAEHKRMYPGYSFRPSKDKASSNTKSEREGTPASDAPTKRKTRTVGPRDMERCEHIAALLAKGLKGAELDAAVKEFDAARVPQTFTPRFEAPLTAQTYAETAKDKDVKENRVKKETEEDMGSSEVGEQVVELVTEMMHDPVRQAPSQSTPHLQPRRVRRSSSAPLLDAGLPITAPAPQYPASSHSHFFQSEAPGTLAYTHHQQSGEFVFGHGQGNQQTCVGSFGSPQSYQHAPLAHGGAELRKRSATSSPHPRRTSYSFSHLHSQPFEHGSAAYPHPVEPQAFANVCSAAHLQRMQAEAQSQVRRQNQHGEHTSGIGLGLECNRNEERGYPSRQQGNEGLSQEATLTKNSGSMAIGNGFWNESVDFRDFTFSGGQNSQTPASAHSSHPNPFDVSPLSTAPSSTTVDELDYSYADMPGLVDAPVYPNFYQAPPRSQHPHLEIQTSWTSEEFSFEQPPASAATGPPSSALDVDSVPSSAVDGSFDFPPPNSAMGLEQGYMDYSAHSQPSSVAVAAPTPCSPASQCGSAVPSSAGARTPIDDAYSAWDQGSAASTAIASASPAATYNSCSMSGPNEHRVAQEHILALRAGFETYLTHAKKIGAVETGSTEAAFEQFARFVQDGMANVADAVGGLKGMGAYGGGTVTEMQAPTQMAHVM